MAIALDGTAAGTSSVGLGSVSWTHTVTSTGPNVELTVGIHTGTNAVSQIGTVTYAGVNMVHVGSCVGSLIYIDVWHLDNPTTGANQVLAQYSGVGVVHAGLSSSYTGVLGIGNSGTSSESGAQTSISGTIASTPGNLVVDYLGVGVNPGTPGAGQTQEVSTLSATRYVTTSDKAGATSTVMSWTFPSTSQGVGWLGVELIVAPVAAVFKALTGAGNI